MEYQMEHQNIRIRITNISTKIRTGSVKKIRIGTETKIRTKIVTKALTKIKKGRRIDTRAHTEKKKQKKREK